MNLPYTPLPAEALTIAQTSLAATLTAVVWFRPQKPRLASVLLVVAIWMAALVPVEPDLFRAMGGVAEPTHVMTLLRNATALATVAMLVARPRWLVIPSLAGYAGLAFLRGYLEQSDFEVAALHLIWFGALLGMHRAVEHVPARAASAPERAPSYARQEIALGALAVVLSVAVAIFVLQRGCDSADEWAYTYQALLFAHGKAYGTVPSCSLAFQSFWVFPYMGRTFSQYTPGWPLIMAPFARMGVPWLAACFTHGLLVVGVARVARRCAAGREGDTSRASPGDIRAAGLVAASVAMFGTTVLLNAGSRFPHVFVAALFAWSIEATCTLATPGLAPRAQWRWGALLGSAAGFLVATRPGDGATLGCGIALYVLYALLGRRIGLRALSATAVTFAFWGGLTLVILRLQLGVWFKTGYSITELIHPWAKFGMSIPRPHELKFGLPIAAGAYCWWPCAPALGVAGLLSVRGVERRVVFMLALGSVALPSFYALVEFGRGMDFGYGPRYTLPLVVPMAVGTGVLFAPIFGRARDLRRAGPAAVIVAVMALGFFRLLPLLYPNTYEDVRQRNTVFVEAERMKLRHAVVIIAAGTTISHPLDLTQNSPTDPNPDVIYVSEVGPAETACVHAKYAGRKFYRTSGRTEITLTPE